MKYFILINQQVLSQTELDVVDGAILDYIYFYCNSQNEKIKKQRIIDKNNEIWTWIDYQSLLNDMPILRLKSISSLTIKIKKIENAGYIESGRFQHIKKYFKMTTKSDDLFIQANRAIHSDEQVPIRAHEPIKNKDNDKEENNKDSAASAVCPDNNLISILDQPTINQLVKEVSPKNISEIIDIFKKTNKAIKFENKTERKASEDLIKEFGFLEAIKWAKFAIEVQGKEFAPQITTPFFLWKKLTQLKGYYNSNKKQYDKTTDQEFAEYDKLSKTSLR